MENDGGDYRVQVHPDPSAIDLDAWNGLLARQAQPTPFLRLEYLRALHQSGSATDATGWTATFITIHRAEHLVGACAAYAKAHSYGEYVFDWAWADAYRRHGLRYYPKLLAAVPFTPVPGSRLLAENDAVRAMLAELLRELARRSRWSSAHALFLSAEDRAAFDGGGWMLREGVQFHWQHSEASPWHDFDDFLRSLQREKRKKIAQERRRVSDAGVRFRVLEGAAISAADWDFFHDCYTLTYAAHHSTPYLTRAFFDAVAQTMPEAWVLFLAEQDGQRVACSLIVVDHHRHAAWGRYWGSVRYIPCLHFEACYYAPLAWCIANGVRRFEGGAQGEHKMARGLMPVRTHSAHWLRDERFASAVGDFLSQESRGITEYVNELEERNPFKADAG